MFCRLISSRRALRQIPFKMTTVIALKQRQAGTSSSAMVRSSGTPTPTPSDTHMRYTVCGTVGKSGGRSRRIPSLSLKSVQIFCSILLQHYELESELFQVACSSYMLRNAQCKPKGSACLMSVLSSPNCAGKYRNTSPLNRLTFSYPILLSLLPKLTKNPLGFSVSTLNLSLRQQ